MANHHVVGRARELRRLEMRGPMSHKERPSNLKREWIPDGTGVSPFFVLPLMSKFVMSEPLTLYEKKLQARISVTEF